MKKNVFIVNAHPDDLIGSAGLAFILAEKQEYELHIVDFSRGERGLTAEGVSMEKCAAMRMDEELAACGMLGVKPVFLNEIDGEICAPRKTCEELSELFLKNPPAVVITHWPVDRHPDHVMCGAATLNALRFAGMTPEVYFHNQTYQTIGMPVIHYVGFSQRIMDLKAELCRTYVCQGGNQIAERKICEARFFGWKADVPYAEAYGSLCVPLSGRHSFFDDLPSVTE